jgi:hypothetical protein
MRSYLVCSTTTLAKIPQYGDPELLPKPTVARPSSLRLPYGPSGELLAEGPALPEDYMLAPDVADLPWKRSRGDEWTDATFRAVVLDWLRAFLRDRSAFGRWRVVEKATAVRSRRLPPEQHYLVVSVTRRSDGAEFESSVQFPPDKRERAEATALLDKVGAAIDAVSS